MLSLLLFAFNAFAIDHLPCQRALLGSTYSLPNSGRAILDPDQVLIKGKLYAFWETGMEDQTGWTVIDSFINTHLSGNGYDSLFPLNEGDRVIILNEDGSIQAEGLHYERIVPGVINFFGRDMEVFPNRPVLMNTLDPTRPVLTQEEYMAAFQREASVIVISRLSKFELEDKNQKLAPKLAALPAHQADPSRFLPIGSGQLHERKMFEQAMTGQIEILPTNVMQLLVADATVELHFNDLIYCLDHDGQALGHFRADRYPVEYPESEERSIVERSSSCLVIRKQR